MPFGFGKKKAAPVEETNLVDLTKKAAVSLEKHQVTGKRAAVYLVIDRSGSMSGYFRNGMVQRLADRVLALSANLDDDGVVPVAMFSSHLDVTFDLTIGQHNGAVDREHRRAGAMGGTRYAPAIKWVTDHYIGSGAVDPAFVVFQTDGQPSDSADVRRLLSSATAHRIKWDFHGWGPGTEFLRELDAMNEGASGAWDNVSTLDVGADPAALSDELLYDHMAQSLAEAVRELG